MAIPLARQQEHNIWYQSRSDPRDLFGGVMGSESHYEHTILVTVHNAFHPITEHILHQVFDPYGKVEMIHILPKSEHFRAALRFENRNSVKSAKFGLHGRNIYDGCCRLDLQFLATSFWNCELSTEDTVESMNSNIYDLKKEMSSTIDKLISQLDNFRKTLAEKEVSQNEPQVFDQMPSKKFTEVSTEKVDTCELESTMKETLAEETEFSYEDEKEASVVEGKSNDTNTKQCKMALGKLEPMAILISETGMPIEGKFDGHLDEDQLFEEILFARCSYIYGGSEQLEWEALSNHYALLYNQRRVKLSYEQKSEKLKEVQYIFEFAAGFASPLARMAPNDIIQSTSGRLDALHSEGTSFFDYISTTNTVRILFDPGGFVVNTWKISLSLNFRCVMVGISDLYLNSLGELMMSWMQMNDFLSFGENSNKSDSGNLHCGALVDIKYLMVQLYSEELAPASFVLISPNKNPIGGQRHQGGFLSVNLSKNDDSAGQGSCGEEWLASCVLGNVEKKNGAGERLALKNVVREQKSGVLKQGGGGTVNTVKHLWVGVISAMISRTFFAPLERLKLEYIVCGDKKDHFELIKSIAASQEIRGFWKGNFVNILQIAPFKAINFYDYDSYRIQLLRLYGNKETTNFERFVVGATARITATMLCIPMDTNRTIMLIPGGEPLGGLNHMIRSGFFSLYKPQVPIIFSMAPSSAVFYAIYDILKPAFLWYPGGKRRLQHMKQQGDELNVLTQLELNFQNFSI